MSLLFIPRHPENTYLPPTRESPAVPRVSGPADPLEVEADRAAEEVSRGGRVSRWSLSTTRLNQVRRQDSNTPLITDQRPKSQADRYKEAASKLGEAFLKTDVGKKLEKAVTEDPLVQGAIDFVSTLPGKVIVGAAAAGVVSALAATHTALPVQIPEIPLDAIRPGLKVKVTYEGPVDHPTQAMISFSYTPEVEKKKSTQTDAERYRAETARIAADQARFRAGLKYTPGSPEDLQQKAEDRAIQAVTQKYSTLPGFGGNPLFPQTPGGRDPNALDNQIGLKPLTAPLPDTGSKKEEPAPVQRKAANDSAASARAGSRPDAISSGGHPLDGETRRFMEGRFGFDFGKVRVHTGGGAAAGAKSISALAYTIGNDVVFGAGQYSPRTVDGRRLIAHELAHVVQNGAIAPSRGFVSAPIDTVQRKCSCGGTDPSGECEECKKQGATLQRKPAGPADPSVVPPVVHEALRSPGHPLDRETRAFFEGRYRHDFGRVRVHDDPRAAESASAVNALAYTVGRHVVFGAGSYAPGTPRGRSLLAHELVHVVQQGGSSAGGDRGLLPPGHAAEQEADRAVRSLANAGVPEVGRRLSAEHVARQEKAGGGTPANAGDAPGSGTPVGAAGATSPQRLRFDVLGADTALADFLAKEARLSRDPDLRVTSLEDLINKLEAQAGPNTGRCVEHISVFNHANPYGQPLVGEGKKKVAADGTPGKLPRSGFFLPWLFNPANQGAVARLRSVFCCGAEMDWVGCSTAGVIAFGGRRSQEEVAASQERFGDEFFRNEYRNAAEALAHGATLQGAIFGSVNVQTWADATCTSIRAANDFVFADYRNPAQPFKMIDLKVGDKEYKGEFILINPTGAGQCGCDSSTGHVRGQWKPGQGIDVGDPKWQADLQQFNAAIKPSAPSSPAQITTSLLALVADVGPSLTIPAGLPAGPKVEPNVVAPSVISYTYEHLVFCHPNDCWKWIGVSPYIIQGTPAYTRTNLNHELLHAADVYAAARKYQQAQGPPPVPPANACVPSYRPADGDPFGRYVLGFHDSYTRGLAPTRHLEIYAESAAKDFQHFTPAEKLDWFKSMLTAVPADIPPGRPLPTEALANGVFQNPIASEQEMRVQFSTALFSMARGFIYGTDPAPVKEKNLGKARTVLNHFGPAWNAFRPGDRRTLSDAIRLEAGD